MSACICVWVVSYYFLYVTTHQGKVSIDKEQKRTTGQTTRENVPVCSIRASSIIKIPIFTTEFFRQEKSTLVLYAVA